MRSFLCFLLCSSLLFETAASGNSDQTKRDKASKKRINEWVITGNVILNANYMINPGDKLVISEGATLTIPNGITLTNSANGPDQGIFNEGLISVAAGGIIHNNGDFHQTSFQHILINGEFNNNSVMYEALFAVNGTFNNNGVIIDGPSINACTVNSGGTFTNLINGVLLAGKFIVNAGGTFTNIGRLNADITFLGGGTITNSGTLAPGNSPGEYDITGNYTATSTAIHDFEVAGTASNQYDRLLVTENLNLNGTLNISLINSFVPSTAHDLTIMTGTVNGIFSTVNIPTSYNLIYNSNSIVLRHLETLPVAFIDFNARKQTNLIQLKWDVGVEENVTRYDIEKSHDGKQFAKINSVTATGQSSYFYNDLNLSNKAFYRIKSIDVNGEYKYSSIIRVVGHETSILLTAFPLPAKNEISLQHPSALTNSKIMVTSVDGKFIMAVVPNRTSQQTILNISNLKAGIYIISYQDANELQTIKVVKQ